MITEWLTTNSLSWVYGKFLDKPFNKLSEIKDKKKRDQFIADYDERMKKQLEAVGLDEEIDFDGLRTFIEQQLEHSILDCALEEDLKLRQIKKKKLLEDAHTASSANNDKKKQWVDTYLNTIFIFIRNVASDQMDSATKIYVNASINASNKNINQRVDGIQREVEVLKQQKDSSINYRKSTYETITVDRNFVHREKELEIIDESLKKGEIIVLGGIGGIGKTSLAEHYAAKCDWYERCNVISCQNSIAYGIASQLHLPDINRYIVGGIPEDDISYSTRLLNGLYQEPPQTRLIIFDDVNPEDPFLCKIEKLNQARIVTSRYRREKWTYSYLEVQVLLEKNQKNLFERYYGRCLSAEESREFSCISSIVEGHTLTLQLIALQCASSDMILSEFRTELEQTGVYTENPDFFSYGKTSTERNMYGHIRAIWNLSQFSEDENRIMQGLSLFTGKGISSRLYKEWLKLSDMNAINRLINQGWIQKKQSANGHMNISLHMVIAEVVYHELYLTHPSNLECIFSKICDKANDRTENFAEQRYWLETSYHIGKRMLPSLHAVLLLNKVSLHYEYFRNFDLAIKSLDQAKENIDKLSMSLSIYGGHTLNNYGVIYQSMGNYRMSLEFYKQAAEVYRCLGCEAEDNYGYTLFNIAKLYIFMNNYDEALRIASIAKNILEKSNYCRLGEVYDLLREYYLHLAFVKNEEWNNLMEMNSRSSKINELREQVKEYLNIALKWANQAVIHLNQYDKDEPEKTMKALSNLAYLKAICGEASSAKEDIQKVLEFYISSTGENSIYVGETYNEMCIIYEKMGDYSTSCMYGEKAIEIFTELLGADHNKTKQAYENLAFACKSPRRQQ